MNLSTITVIPFFKAGSITDLHNSALAAQNKYVSAIGFLLLLFFTHLLICSPRGVFPGSCKAIELIPESTSFFTSLLLWVDFPDPSPPSKVINKPFFRIRKEDSNNNPNEFYIATLNSSSTVLPEGITIRLSERDDNNNVKYFKDYRLPLAVDLSDANVTIILDPDDLKWHNCFAFGNDLSSFFYH